MFDYVILDTIILNYIMLPNKSSPDPTVPGTAHGKLGRDFRGFQLVASTNPKGPRLRAQILKGLGFRV